MIPLNGPIYQVKTRLSDAISLHVHLVKGTDYAVWIDSGINALLPQLIETMARAGAADLRFVLHTHSHHDHIGSNGQLIEHTGCLIAAPAHYAAWHADFERHYQEFARPFPRLVPDTPALREEVLGILDSPHKLDLHIDEGIKFDLGGGVTLEAWSLPGHMLAELGWFEASTRTLILGDAITGLDWPLFHSHLSVRAYRETLGKIRRLLPRLGVEQVLFAHFPPMRPPEVETLLDKAAAYIDEIETTMLVILEDYEQTTLETLWDQTCARMGRMREFRALNMVFAHVRDLIEREMVREVAPECYMRSK